VPQKKLDLIIEYGKFILDAKYVTARRIARLKGIIIAFKHAISFTAIFTSSMNRIISLAYYFWSIDCWDVSFILPDWAACDVQYWVENVLKLNGCPMWNANWKLDIFSDAAVASQMHDFVSGLVTKCTKRFIFIILYYPFVSNQFKHF